MLLRPYLMLLLLTFAAYGAEQDSPSAAVATEPETSASAPQDKGQGLLFADQLLQRDWQDNPASKTIDKEQVLFAEHDGENNLGLAVLLPDWQGASTLWALSLPLTGQGFDTLLILPSANQRTLNPAGEKKDPARDAFRKGLAKRIQSLAEAKQQEGFRLILAQGSAAAWIGDLLTSNQLPAPDALVLLDAHFPDRDANRVLAKELAQSPVPVLDLYQEGATGWLPLAAEARRQESRRSDKDNYRAYALQSQDEIPARLQGWLHHLGWL